MKQLFSISVVTLLLFAASSATAQADKSKRPSPPATATQKTGETTITINYSQPSVKGRTIGTDLEPLPGKVWRAGANEATVFEVDKDVTVDGKLLPMGKYGLFILANEQKWTVIFNKTWDQWGAFKYKETDDVLRVTTTAAVAKTFSEKLRYDISADGVVTLFWGDTEMHFTVKQSKN